MTRHPPEHPEGITRVQVGCGPHHIRPDWWNVDIRKFRGVDEALDATQPWRWRDRLSYVYAEHFLEHLSIAGGISFLTHAGNALRVGGKLRLSTPGLEWVIASHFALKETEEERMVAQTLKTNRAFYGWGHQFLYSRSMLAYVLRQLGFIDIRFFAYGESGDDELRGVEKHGKYSVLAGYPSVWIVEATKGEAAISAPAALIELVQQELMRHVQGGH